MPGSLVMWTLLFVALGTVDELKAMLGQEWVILVEGVTPAAAYQTGQGSAISKLRSLPLRVMVKWLRTLRPRR
jgi:hypothetical protein